MRYRTREALVRYREAPTPFRHLPLPSTTPAMPLDNITYRTNAPIDLDSFINLYKASTLAERRPANDRETMRQMLQNADVIVSAWDKDCLVGVSRTLTDYGYVAYLSDLAVAQTHQRGGIGRRLIEETQKALGEQCMMVLIAAPAANTYYPRLGFTHNPRAWVLPGGARLKAPRPDASDQPTEPRPGSSHQEGCSER